MIIWTSTGDYVIRQVAQTLSEVSRDNDTAARLGGEEFALLLASIDVEKAGAAAERLREVISNTACRGRGSRYCEYWSGRMSR